LSDSSIPKFFEKNRKERLRIVGEFSGLSKEELDLIENSSGGISFDDADKMIENAIGTFSLPLGIATNFRINDKDYLVPMVIEEPSVIAAASKAAKIARLKGGFKAEADESYSLGQIQVVDVDPKDALLRITQSYKEILDIANSKSKTLSKIGKGAKEVSCREIQTGSGSILVVELLIDVGDAMGANITNTMCEAVAPIIEKLTGGRVLLRILSNYSTRRMVRASAVFDLEGVGGSNVVDDIVLMNHFFLQFHQSAVLLLQQLLQDFVHEASCGLFVFLQ